MIKIPSDKDHNKENLKKRNINNSFSYGKYLVDNPKATKDERIKAIHKFYQDKK